MTTDPRQIVDEYCSKEGAPALNMGHEIAVARSIVSQISRAHDLEHAKQLATAYLDMFLIHD